MIPNRRLLAPLIVLLAAFWAHGPALDGGLVYDDEPYLTENSAVSGEASPWTSPLGDPRQGLWRPITVLSQRLEWKGSADVRGLHRTNILLHALASLLVLLLARRLDLDQRASVVAALLFAVHPVHAESVAWITGRAELLATLFVLVAWCAHLGEGRRSAILSMVALALAGLSKENALAAPALFLVGDLARQRLRLGRLAALGAACVGLFLARLSVLPSLLPMEGPFTDVPLAGRAVVALNILGRAVGLLAWPAPLRIEYQRQEFLLFQLGPALAAAVLIGLIVWCWPRWRSLALGLVAVPIAMIPVLNLVPIGESFAERFLYLPSVGFCLAAGAALSALASREQRSGRGLGPSLAILLVAVGLALPTTRAATKVFHDDLSLWRHAARVAPDLPLTRYNHGAFLDRAGRHLSEDRDNPGCIEELRASLELDPGHIYAGFAHQILGTHALGQQGTPGPANAWLAAEHFRSASELLPGLVEPRLNLATIAAASPDVVDPSEALQLLAPLSGIPDLPAEQRLAVQELVRQLAGGSSPPQTTGTSSPDGS